MSVARRRAGRSTCRRRWSTCRCRRRRRSRSRRCWPRRCRRRSCSRRVVRVDRDRAGRVDPERAAEVLPVRLAGQRVLRAPDPAAGRRDVEPAVAGLARRRDRDRRRAPAGDVLGRHVAERVPERCRRIERLDSGRPRPTSPWRPSPSGTAGPSPRRTRIARRPPVRARSSPPDTRAAANAASAALAGPFVGHALVPGRGLAELREVAGRARSGTRPPIAAWGAVPSAASLPPATTATTTASARPPTASLRRRLRVMRFPLRVALRVPARGMRHRGSLLSRPARTTTLDPVAVTAPADALPDTWSLTL